MNGFKKENTGTIDKVVIASTQHIGMVRNEKPWKTAVKP